MMKASNKETRQINSNHMVSSSYCSKLIHKKKTIKTAKRKGPVIVPSGNAIGSSNNGYDDLKYLDDIDTLPSQPIKHLMMRDSLKNITNSSSIPPQTTSLIESANVAIYAAHLKPKNNNSPFNNANTNNSNNNRLNGSN